MSTGGSAIRGSRVGAGPMGEQDRGFKAERITVSYYCSAGHEYSPQYAAAVELSEIPEMIDCPNCGLPAGQDKANPPIIAKHEPYKTHLAYVKERRTVAEAKELLEEAVAAVRERRIRLAEEAKVAAKEAAKAATKKASAAAKAATSAAKTAPAKENKSVANKPTSKPAVSKAAKPVAKAPAKATKKAPVKASVKKK
jgi:chemotaxis protein histidine kinase CheA